MAMAAAVGSPCFSAGFKVGGRRRKKRIRDGAASTSSECPLLRMLRNMMGIHRIQEGGTGALRGEGGLTGNWSLAYDGKSKGECRFGLEVRKDKATTARFSRVGLQWKTEMGDEAAKQQEMFVLEGKLQIRDRHKQGTSMQVNKDTVLTHNVFDLQQTAQGDGKLHSFLRQLHEIQLKAYQGVKQYATSAVSAASSSDWSSYISSTSLLLGVAVIVFLTSIAKLKHAGANKGQAVKARIHRSQWFKDSRAQAQNQRFSKSPKVVAKGLPNLDSIGHSYNHLVIHDGQVVRGSSLGDVVSDVGYSPGKKASPGSILAQTQTDFHSSDTDIGNNVDQQQEISSSKSSIPYYFSRKRVSSSGSKQRGSNGASSSPSPSSRTLRPGRSYTTIRNHNRNWNNKDEIDLSHRVEELRQKVQSAEDNRKAAIRALADERRRSLELEVKISRQKEAAVALEEEVRVLKESHEALLTSLRKKYSSSVAARAAAALLYQNWEGGDV